MFKFQIGDRVRIIGDRETGTIVNIIEEVALVKYANGSKKKISLVNLLPPLQGEITITREKFDEAVKALMYGVAENVGDTDRLDGVLEIVGMVCNDLKSRLFEGND